MSLNKMLKRTNTLSIKNQPLPSIFDSICSLWISPYTLTEKVSKKTHSGCLLKVLFKENKIGYSVLHPFPCFGDPPVSFYLQELKNKRETDLTSVSLEDALMDAEARFKNINLLSFGMPIENHHLILDLHCMPNWDSISSPIVKIKMGRDLKKESLKLKQLIQSSSCKKKLRLDFNYRLNRKTWNQWIQDHAFLLPDIDFIEDPFRGFWTEPSRWPIAWDWGKAPYCPIRVIKASRFSLKELCSMLAQGQFQRIIFSHCLTHPLEAHLSLVKARQFYKIHPKKKEVCGLNYLWDFYEGFESYKHKSQGTGLGFDSLLQQQDWLPVF